MTIQDEGSARRVGSQPDERPDEGPRHRFGARPRWLRALLAPIAAETRSRLADRWAELPEDLRSDRQMLGRYLVHCGYTLGPSYCSFGCTHCYLPTNANRAPMPSLAEMKAQIEANRELLGPGGALQITGGDVLDAYRRAGRMHELVEVIGHARDRELVPMVMTHGQALLDEPDLLDELVLRGGLSKIGIHVDITQAGRPGHPIRALNGEEDLHPLRRRFVELILASRRRTGRPLSAAHTVTVTERNLGSVAAIPKWFAEDPRHPEAFTTLSFQTEAAVGRTRISERRATPEAVWRRIAEGFGAELPAAGLWFGHPDCSRMLLLLLHYPEGRVSNLVPDDPDSHRAWARLAEMFGGFGGRTEGAGSASLRKLAILARDPAGTVVLLGWLRRLLARPDLGPGALWRLARGRLRGLNVVLHNFMDADQLAAPRDAVVERRLETCSFRGAVRRGEGWEAVPMCSMNALEREELYRIG